MKTDIPGIHHVSAIAGPPQRNVDFYVGFLGLRLVKKTVNFDDPGTYHLYYGDETGHPGTIMTFFPFSEALPGRAGVGMASETAFSVPEQALDYWMQRFADAAYDFDAPGVRFGEQVLAFRDPDGLRVELVAQAGTGALPGWKNGPVPADHALRSFHSVTLAVAAPERTARLLTDLFGYAAAGEEDGRLRFEAPGGAPGSIIDLVQTSVPGRMGAGTVHHVAFRARDDEQQLTWQDELTAAGLSVTPVRERNYFRSVYFREPNGILFEIATDPPGFTADESVEALGTHLMLPEWLEPRRRQIEMRLVDLSLPFPRTAAK